MQSRVSVYFSNQRQLLKFWLGSFFIEMRCLCKLLLVFFAYETISVFLFMKWYVEYLVPYKELVLLENPVVLLMKQNPDVKLFL